MTHAEKLKQYIGLECQLMATNEYTTLVQKAKLEDSLPKGTIAEVGDGYAVISGQLGAKKWETVMSLNRVVLILNK